MSLTNTTALIALPQLPGFLCRILPRPSAGKSEETQQGSGHFNRLKTILWRPELRLPRLEVALKKLLERGHSCVSVVSGMMGSIKRKLGRQLAGIAGSRQTRIVRSSPPETMCLPSAV